MTITEVENWTFKEVKRLLTKAGLIDGVLLDPDQVKNEDRTMFWFKKIKDLEPSKKKIYVIWDIPSATPIGYADDKVAVRSVYVTIDLFTKLGLYHQKTREILNQISAKFIEAGWQFERAQFDAIDHINDLTLTRYAATIKL